MHVARSLKGVVSLNDTLNMETGEPVPKVGLETAEIFLKSRTKEMHERCREFELEDAQGPGGGLNTHTVHFAWMRWFKYAKANDRLNGCFMGCHRVLQQG